MRGRVLLLALLVLAGLTLSGPVLANHGPGDLRDCDDFAFQEDAQAHLDAHPGDPDRLDPGGLPGVACEDLPIRPQTTSPLPNIVPPPTGASPTTAPSPATTRAPTPTTTAAPAATTTRPASPTTTRPASPTTTRPASPTTTLAAPTQVSPSTTAPGAPMPNTGAFTDRQAELAGALLCLGLALLVASNITTRTQRRMI